MTGEPRVALFGKGSRGRTGTGFAYFMEERGWNLCVDKMKRKGKATRRLYRRLSAEICQIRPGEYSFFHRCVIKKVVVNMFWNLLVEFEVYLNKYITYLSLRPALVSFLFVGLSNLVLKKNTFPSRWVYLVASVGCIAGPGERAVKDHGGRWEWEGVTFFNFNLVTGSVSVDERGWIIDVVNLLPKAEWIVHVQIKQKSDSKGLQKITFRQLSGK